MILEPFLFFKNLKKSTRHKNRKNTIFGILVILELIDLKIALSGQKYFFSNNTPLNMDMLMKKPFLFPEKP